MSIKVSGGIAAAIVFGLAAGSLVTVPAKPAQAQGLFELLFNPERYNQRRRFEERRRRFDLRGEEGSTGFYVSSPKYYTYKPDQLTRIPLAKLAEPKPEPAEEAADSAGERAANEEVAKRDTGTMTDATAADDGAVETGGPGEAPGAGAAMAAPAIGTAGKADPAGQAEPTAFQLARGNLASLRIVALPEIADAIMAHYDAHPDFVWISDGAVNDRARAVMAALQRADLYGLSPDYYRVAMPGEVTGAISNGAGAGSAEDAGMGELMTFEMQLSAAVLSYALDATRGRVDPNRLSGYHDIPRKKVDLSSVLGDAAAAPDAGAWLDARNPDSPHFRAFVAELAALRAADEDENRIEIAPGTFMRPGASNPELVNVIAAVYRRSSTELKEKHAGTLSSYAGGEKYTPELVEVVRDFQRESKLHPDGVIGPNTIKAMIGLSNADKIAKVRLAMERSRWLPEDLGARHVLINQAAFRATYSEEGREPLSMKVVVGKKSNQTSFFMDEIETVEFNPYWGVPYSIIVNEMLPKLASDPSYLDRLGYEVTTASGRQVSSSSVDWYGVADKSVSINVRQRPGRSNALGELKILFPNKHDIYMHDTPAKELFKRDARAFSHGCVRLEDPRAMAAAVLGKDVAYIASRIAQGKNDSDTVEQKIPVYVAYFTAWLETDGAVHFYNDVYDRDEHLLEALEIDARVRRAEG